jgi:hypothetical protein
MSLTQGHGTNLYLIMSLTQGHGTKYNLFCRLVPAAWQLSMLVHT